ASGPSGHPHSFPTRRSSDLGTGRTTASATATGHGAEDPAPTRCGNSGTTLDSSYRQRSHGGTRMVELGILFGLLGVAALGLVVVLLRRQNGRTENADGLRIERARLVR